MPRRKSVKHFKNSLNFTAINATELDIGVDIYDFERTDAFSWSQWIKPRTVSSTQILGGEWDNGGDNFAGWHTRFVGGALRGWLIGSGGTGASLRNDYVPPEMGEWVLLTFTYDGSSAAAGLKCYYDDEEQTPTATLDLLATSMVSVGKEMIWGGWIGETAVFNGKMTRMRVFDYELSAAQVADLYYDDKISGVAPLDEYLCSEGGGTGVASTGTAGNDGTLVTIPWEHEDTPYKRRKTNIHYPYALDFDGVDDTHMNCGTGIYAFERTDSFSFSFDMNPSGLSDDNTDIFQQSNAGAPFDGIYIRLRPANILRLWLIGSAGTAAGTYSDFTRPDPTKYTKVIITYDGSSQAAGIRCYYDGVEQISVAGASSLASTLINASNPTEWGTRGNHTNVYQGFLAHMRVFDYELSRDQIDDLVFDGQVTGTAPLDEYLCKEGSGNNVASTGSAGNDGTLTAVAWEATNVPSKSRSAIAQARTAIS